MIRNICLIFLLGLVSFSNAQNQDVNDLIALNIKLSEMRSYKMDYLLSVYTVVDNSQILVLENEGFIKRDMNKYHFLTGQIETMFGEDFSVMIIHDQKLLQYNINPEAEPIAKERSFSMDSISNSVIRYVKNTSFFEKKRIGNIDKYSMRNKGNEIVEMEFHINYELNTVEKVKYVYKSDENGNQAIVDIKFSNIDMMAKYEAREFSLTQFISRINGDIVVGKKYLNYKIKNVEDYEN